MPDYQLGKIYKIVCNETNQVYIGSTCRPLLSQRLAKHNYSYKYYLKGKYRFITSFKILERNNYEIILVELYPCNSKDELSARERYWIENTKNCVNKCIPTRTKKEYSEANKDKIKETKKQYREANKDKINEKILCSVCNSYITRQNISSHNKTNKHISNESKI